MPLMPAHCFNCGLTFTPETGVHMENVEGITLDLGYTCPRCGREARIVEGTFDADRETVTMRSGPAWSRDVLDQVAAAAARAQTLLDDGVKPKVVERRFVEDAEAASPEAAQVVRWLKRPSHLTVAAWIGAVVGVVTLVQAHYAEQGATPEQIHQIYEDVLRERGEAPEPAPDPSSTPPTPGDTTPPPAAPRP